MSTQTKIKFEPVTIETAQEPAKSTLQQAKNNLGFVPNMYEFMAVNPSLLSSYTASYNAFREQSGFTSQEQEVILLSVSYVNECDYCMAAHSFVADKMSNVPTEVTDAIREGREIPDAKLAALSKFTKEVVKDRGYVSQEAIQEFLEAGYEKKHVFGVITGVGVKTFSNYMNHIAETPLDDMFSSRKWEK
ncbi:MAG: carboxymuconolactone decarboxylase family protein [Balneolaceae bacterium]